MQFYSVPLERPLLGRSDRTTLGAGGSCSGARKSASRVATQTAPSSSATPVGLSSSSSTTVCSPISRSTRSTCPYASLSRPLSCTTHKVGSIDKKLRWAMKSVRERFGGKAIDQLKRHCSRGCSGRLGRRGGFCKGYEAARQEYEKNTREKRPLHEGPGSIFSYLAIMPSIISSAPPPIDVSRASR